jgi:hypothetical protein
MAEENSHSHILSEENGTQEPPRPVEEEVAELSLSPQDDRKGNDYGTHDLL